MENHELLEKIDSKFAKKGAMLMMLHEKQHLEGPADKFFYDYAFKAIESQANLQTINKNRREFGIENIEELKEFIEAIVTYTVYVDFIYNRIDSLEYEGGTEQYIHFNDYYNFLKLDIIDKIVDRENEIRKELLEKYNKLEDRLKDD